MSVRRVDDIPADTSEAPGVAIRTLTEGGGVELKVLDVEAGGSTPFHTHDHAHEAVVLGGTGTLRSEEETRPLAAGDVFSVAAYEPHAVENRGAEPLRFVCMDCFAT